MKNTTISFQLPAELKAATKVAAIRTGMSLQDFIHQVLRADARIAAELPTIHIDAPAPAPAAARAPRAPRQRRK